MSAVANARRVVVKDISERTTADKINRGIVTFLFGLVTWPLRGWVIAWYWNWFMAESFFLPPFSIAHGLAFSMVVSAARASSKLVLEKEHPAFYYVFCDTIISLLLWVTGWLFHAVWVALNVPQMFGWVPS